MIKKKISLGTILIGICVFFGAFFGTKYAADRANLFDLNSNAYYDLDLPKIPESGALDEEEYEAIAQQ